MYVKLLSLFAAVALVAACESTPTDTGAASGSGRAGLTTGTGGTGGIVSGAIRPGSQEDLASLGGQGTGDRVFFQYDRSDLTPEARATLDRQANWLRQYGQVTVTIEGHTDERGTREYNIGLGNRRATAVRNYLTALGIDGGRVVIISYGKERPAVLGDNDGSWAQNRRGVTIVN
ncbi:MAG: peptidoglycan-associated lipoprotein Pal [Rhodospirillaceae bacterium]